VRVNRGAGEQAFSFSILARAEGVSSMSREIEIAFARFSFRRFSTFSRPLLRNGIAYSSAPWRAGRLPQRKLAALPDRLLAFPQVGGAFPVIFSSECKIARHIA